MRNLVGVAPEVTCSDSGHLNSGMGPFDHVYYNSRSTSNGAALDTMTLHPVWKKTYWILPTGINSTLSKDGMIT